MTQESHVDIEVPVAYQATVLLKGKRNPSVEQFLEFVPFRLRNISGKDVPRRLRFMEFRQGGPDIEEELFVHEGDILMPALAERNNSGSGPYAPCALSDHAHAVSILKAVGWLGSRDIQFARNPMFDRCDIPISFEAPATEPGKVRKVLSHEKETKIAEALDAAASMICIDGRLYSRNYEPVATIDGGETAWRSLPWNRPLFSRSTVLSDVSGILLRADDPLADRDGNRSRLMGDLDGVTLRFDAAESTIGNLLSYWVTGMNNHGEEIRSVIPLRHAAFEIIRREMTECRRHVSLLRSRDHRYDFDALVGAAYDLRNAIDANGAVFHESV